MCIYTAWWLAHNAAVCLHLEYGLVRHIMSFGMLKSLRYWLIFHTFATLMKAKSSLLLFWWSCELMLLTHRSIALNIQWTSTTFNNILIIVFFSDCITIYTIVLQPIWYNTRIYVFYFFFGCTWEWLISWYFTIRHFHNTCQNSILANIQQHPDLCLTTFPLSPFFKECIRIAFAAFHNHIFRLLFGHNRQATQKILCPLYGLCVSYRILCLAFSAASLSGPLSAGRLNVKIKVNDIR